MVRFQSVQHKRKGRLNNAVNILYMFSKDHSLSVCTFCIHKMYLYLYVQLYLHMHKVFEHMHK